MIVDFHQQIFLAIINQHEKKQKSINVNKRVKTVIKEKESIDTKSTSSFSSCSLLMLAI
jgi:hypothetical protein